MSMTLNEAIGISVHGTVLSCTDRGMIKVTFRGGQAFIETYQPISAEHLNTTAWYVWRSGLESKTA